MPLFLQGLRMDMLLLVCNIMMRMRVKFKIEWWRSWSKSVMMVFSRRLEVSMLKLGMLML